MRLLLPSLLLVAACTPTARDLEQQADAQAGARAALDRELAGLVPGRPQNCVRQFDLRGAGLRSYGDTLVYSTGTASKYVTRTSGGCERIGQDSILVTRTPTSDLCRGEIATTVDRTSGFFSGSCSFGEFIRYQKPPSAG